MSCNRYLLIAIFIWAGVLQLQASESNEVDCVRDVLPNSNSLPSIDELDADFLKPLRECGELGISIHELMIEEEKDKKDIFWRPDLAHIPNYVVAMGIIFQNANNELQVLQSMDETTGLFEIRPDMQVALSVISPKGVEQYCIEDELTPRCLIYFRRGAFLGIQSFQKKYSRYLKSFEVDDSLFIQEQRYWFENSKGEICKPSQKPSKCKLEIETRVAASKFGGEDAFSILLCDIVVIHRDAILQFKVCKH